MATYQEIYDLRTDSGLKNRITVAVAVKAAELLETAVTTPQQVQWAVEALRNPGSKADELFLFMLASGKGRSVVEITSMPDQQVQNKVDKAVDKIIAGGV